MPRVITHIAKFDTYSQGARIETTKTKRGYRIDRSKPFDEKDTIFAKKGETYYSWSFRYGGTHRSKTRPKASQLTQSDFLSRIYSITENQPDFDSKEELTCWIDETISELEELRDECEEKRENMPYQLQDSGTGETLQNRYDSVQEWIDELESLKERCEDEDSEEDLMDLVSDINDYQGE